MGSPFSDFPNGITSFGVPIMGGPGMLPIMGPTAKVFFVAPAVGSDDNTGLSLDSPLDTVDAALAKCTSGNGDTIYLISDGSSTGTARDTALTWSKNNTHLIGLCAPTMVNKRARIAPPTTDTDVDAYTPYLTVSASGCIFANVNFFQGNSEDSKASIGILVSGNQNYFYNVGVQNGAHANQGDESTYNLEVTGDENTFEKCLFGVDTVAWTGDTGKYPANIRLGSGNADEAQRNVFLDCLCVQWADGTGNFFVYVSGLTDIQRWNLFKRCNFINTGTSTLTAGVNVPGSATGRLFFDDCGFFGCTDVTAADSTLVFMKGPASGVCVEVGMFKGVDIA